MKLKRKKVNVNRVGRPKMPQDEKQKYSRLAVYPETHERIKALAKAKGVNIIDWIEYQVPGGKDGPVQPKDLDV